MRWLLILIMGAYPAVATQGAPYGPLVTFQTQNILPPGAVYVSPNDTLELIARSPSVATAIQLTVRTLSPAGIVQNTLQTASIKTNGTATQNVELSPQEGFMLSAQVVANNASRGQCFVKLQLHSGATGSDPTLGALLMQGYVSADDHLSYPQSPTESSLNGRGWIHTIVIANPGAGTEWFQVVPAGVRWALRAVHALFDTSAVAANRIPFLTVSDNAGNENLAVPAPAVIPASQTEGLTWADGLVSTVVGNVQSQGAPRDLILPSAWQISSVTQSLQAADQWLSIVLTVEEWVAQ